MSKVCRTCLKTHKLVSIVDEDNVNGDSTILQKLETLNLNVSTTLIQRAYDKFLAINFNQIQLVVV
jgi:thymidylate synthase